ncbi:MAG: TIGR00282 family metallophosphoesterase [Desulfobacterota bacterium]|nr:TIGR00282 family metallophosphoesterase [Thermodesulfobacteriota bacterium]
MKVLFIGDIIGKPGRKAVKAILPEFLAKEDIDIIFANGENAAGGFGITPKVAQELKKEGIDVITSGNHIWDRKEIIDFLDKEEFILRPENYPDGVPGRGSGVFNTKTGLPVGVINLVGRAFMGPLECPFRVALQAIEKIKKVTPIIVVDFHAEATSEKGALGWFLDGKVSAVIGTHTHVQTADERILPEGTAFITDVGMVGALDSVIGIKKEIIIQRFLSQTPCRFEPATNDLRFQGVIIEINNEHGKSIAISRINYSID